MVRLRSAARARRIPTLAARLAAPLLLLSLAGCAAQLAYRDGEQLAAQQQVPAAMAKFREAIERDPGNAKYRLAYTRTRDQAVRARLAQADNAVAAGLNAPANWQRVLELDPANERARAGLRAQGEDARVATLLAQAHSAALHNDPEAARRLLAALLVERPQHEGARALLRSLDDSATPAPAAPGGLAQMFKKPISIEFKDTPLRQVFEVIARGSGLNFVFDKDVKTDMKASIFLKDSNIEAAIYYLLVSNQLEQQVLDGNTVLIYPNIAAKLKEYQEMVVKTYFLANADAKSIANTFKTILKSRDVVVDEKLNLVILRDNADAVRLADKLVALQDVAEPEVMLEVEVLEVKRSRLMELGVAWPNGVSLTPLSTSGGVGLTLDDLRGLNRSSIGISTPSLTVNAHKTDGDANILANPRIRVRNHEKAKVVIGDRVPNISVTVSPGAGGFASETVSYVDVGLTLNVEPTIYLNNEVAIRVGLEVSNLVDSITTKSGTVAYHLGTRQASTMLQLKDGENQVLAGLISGEERSNANKLPGLGDLPLLGRLFGSTVDDSSKTEIVLSITPHLVRNIVRPDAAAAQFASGTEASMRHRPVAPLRAPMAPPPAIPGASLPAAASAPLPAAGSAPVAGAAPAAAKPQTVTPLALSAPTPRVATPAAQLPAPAEAAPAEPAAEAPDEARVD